MPRFARGELLSALAHYTETVGNCSRTGDWAPFADLFTDDVTYIEHAYGVFHGREAVRRWITEVMKPFPHMRIRHTWIALDEDNGAIVMEIQNVLVHPAEPGTEFSFPNISRIVYAGDNLFSCQEDIYNPARDAPRVIGEWLRAGGVLLARPLPMRHV